MKMIRTLIVLILASTVAATASAEDPAVTAARVRQESIRTVRFEVKLREFWAKGSVSGANSFPMPNMTETVVIPKLDTTIESNNVLEFSDNMVRVELNHPSFHLPSGELAEKLKVFVTNGEFAKNYHPHGVGPAEQHTGIIKSNLEVDGKAIWLAIAVNARGLVKSITPYPIADSKPSGETLRIDGKSCQLYSSRTGSDRLVEFWIDPQSDYIVRRIRWSKSSRVDEQLDIQFKDESASPRLPSSWTRTNFDAAGHVKRTMTGTVTAVRINSPIPKEDFEVVFPPGCRVYDQRTNKDYRIESDGDMRELTTEGEASVHVEPQPGTPWLTRNRFPIIGIVAGSLLIAFILILHRRRMRRRLSRL